MAATPGTEPSSRSKFTSLRTTLPALALLALLAVLAALQVRWLEQMRVADDERTRADLEARLGRVAEDFNRQLERLFVDLQPLRRRAPADSDDLPDDLPRRLAELLATWRETADYPDLVEAAYLVHPAAMRTGFDRDPAPLWRIEPLVAQGDAELPDALRQPVAAFFRHAHARGAEPGPPGPPTLLVGNPPALLVPLFLPPARLLERDVDERDARRSRRRGWRRRNVKLLAVILHRPTLEGELLPALIEDAFGSRPTYQLRLVEKASGELIASFGPQAPVGASVDARVELFGPIALDRRFTRRGRGPRPPASGLASAGLESGLWRLEASHPAGSLARAVESAHRRNLVVSLGILAILAAALVVLARGASRSRRLARQQLDFVAGITHELMTPLAALRSAGQNLADGVVSEPSQIERYGRMIDREGQRLGDLVGQVLAFSRMQSGEPNFHLQSLDAGAELGAVLEEMRPTLEAARIELDVRVGKDAEDRPRVLADAQALRRALSNLLANAVKYGQTTATEKKTAEKGAAAETGAEKPGGWIGCSTWSAEGGTVVFEIADRGPGIAASDRPHLFEPFYRGKGLAAGSKPGAGLGLALVRHLVEGQGGRVEVRPHRPGRPNPGAAFRLVLPAADRDEAE